jgi:aspartyl protease family protein
VKKAILPALALFSAAALGFMALRDRLPQNFGPDSSNASSPNAKAAVTETEAATAVTPVITSSQIRQASLRKESDGHFWATAYVNDEPVRFLVDTGASLVALTTQDARRAGIDTDKLEANAEVRTAAGRVKAAVANIDSIEIDGVTVKNVQAVVIDKGLEYSLLGMSFLNRLEGWDVTPTAIVIRQ